MGVAGSGMPVEKSEGTSRRIALKGPEKVEMAEDRDREADIVTCRNVSINIDPMVQKYLICQLVQFRSNHETNNRVCHNNYAG